MPLAHKETTQNQVVYAECTEISELREEKKIIVAKFVERILKSAQFAP